MMELLALFGLSTLVSLAFVVLALIGYAVYLNWQR